MPRKRTRGHRHKLKYKKFCSNIRNFLTLEVIKHWNRFSRVVVGSFEIPKAQVDIVLSNLL